MGWSLIPVVKQAEAGVPVVAADSSGTRSTDPQFGGWLGP
jgi:hypothetical protein